MSDAKKEEANKPELFYWYVWADDEGVSHQMRVQLTSFVKESMGGDAPPQWNKYILQADSKILFAEMPVGWVGSWHENPQPQWIVPLSGRWYVETMDGNRVEMGPGDVSFGGDQNTKPNGQGHKGHLSGTIGHQPVMLMIVQLIGNKWKGRKPGDFT